MKTLFQLTLAVVLGFGLVGNTLAQQARDAGSKARGEVMQFWVGKSANSHARDNARSLYYYGQTQQVVPAAPAQQYVQDVRQNLATSQKALGELKKGNPDNKEAQAALAKIAEIHKKVLGHCDMLDKELGKSEAKSATICDCCVDLHADLDAADAEFTKLMKALKIEKLELPNRDSQPTAPAKK